MSAQALACGLAGAVIGLTAFLLATAVAIPWLSAKDAPLPPVSELLELVAGVVAYAGLSAALGAGLGALLRNQVAGVVIVLVGLFVVDPTLAALDESVAGFTLSGLGAAISGADDNSSELLEPVVAGLVWAPLRAPVRRARRDPHGEPRHLNRLQDLNVGAVADHEAVRLRKRWAAADRHVLADQARLDAVVEHARSAIPTSRSSAPARRTRS